MYIYIFFKYIYIYVYICIYIYIYYMRAVDTLALLRTCMEMAGTRACHACMCDVFVLVLCLPQRAGTARLQFPASALRRFSRRPLTLQGALAAMLFDAWQ